MRRGQSRDYPAFPDIEQELSYNPARFLDSTIERTDCTTDLTVTALIHGINDIETIRAWIAVEVDLGRNDGGPRREIIKQLNRRQAQLENDAAPVDGATAAEPAEATESEPASQTADPAKTDKRDEPGELSESSKPSQPSQPDAAPTEEGPITVPTCPVCGEALVSEEIAGQFRYWCCECRDVREPKATPSMDAIQEDPILVDGGETESPRCPDCRAELTLEEIRDETAHWCAYCGGFREPIGGTA